MTIKQLRRVRIAYHFSRFSDRFSAQKVRGAYPTWLANLAKLETEIQAGMKELELML